MIMGTFDVAIDTPKRHKRATIALKSNEGRIAARLDMGDVRGLEFAGTCVDQDFAFEGSTDFGEDIGEISYSVKGNVWGNSINAKCETSIGNVTIFGTRLSREAGEFKSSHDYLMAAAADDFSDEATMYSGAYGDAS